MAVNWVRKEGKKYWNRGWKKLKDINENQGLWSLRNWDVINYGMGEITVIRIMVNHITSLPHSKSSNGSSHKEQKPGIPGALDDLPSVLQHFSDFTFWYSLFLSLLTSRPISMVPQALQAFALADFSAWERSSPRYQHGSLLSLLQVLLKKLLFGG